MREASGKAAAGALSNNNRRVVASYSVSACSDQRRCAGGFAVVVSERRLSRARVVVKRSGRLNGELGRFVGTR